MVKEKGLYRRYVRAGPGGVNCGCCFPQTNPGRKAAFRATKREERRFIELLIKEALE
jgi:hypothetical protein